MLGLFGAILALGAFVSLAEHYWERYRAREDAEWLRGFVLWLGKGLGVPLAAWTVLNAGCSVWLPPLTPQVHLAKYGGGPWLPVLGEALGASWAAIGGGWAAVTFAWLLARTSVEAAYRREVLVVTAFWTVVLAPLLWLILRGYGVAAAGGALLLWLWPVAHFILPLVQRERLLPTYTRAVARIKFGKYAAAEQEVLAQLERCEDDFEGWMLLADLYANHFGDLAAADQTIRDLCDQPNVTAIQVSLAFQRLAEWQLRLGDDPVRARRALEEVCRRLPGSTFAREARQRAAGLPGTRDEWREQRQARPVRLPPLSDQLDEETTSDARPQYDRSETLRLTDQCVSKLKRDPNDTPTRERLAVLLAERLDRPELGIEQLGLLVALPGQPPAHTARWLSQMAAWHLKLRHDWEAAQPLLERLVREFPQSSQAFAAQRRLNLRAVERRARPGPPAPGAPA